MKDQVDSLIRITNKLIRLDSMLSSFLATYSPEGDLPLRLEEMAEILEGMAAVIRYDRIQRDGKQNY